MKSTFYFLGVMVLFIGNAYPQYQDALSIKTNNAMNTTIIEDHYTFPLRDLVTREKVEFKNRFGITLVGDLYIPKNLSSQTFPALALSGPFGAVKEQSSGLYAQQMAEQGFIALAFDPSYTGESGGDPRNIASPDINTEDFSAAIDFLGLLAQVDRERIGIIGICGFGGFALNAAIADKRIKAVATTSMYDITRVSAHGYNDQMTAEERAKMLAMLSQKRWEDAEKGNADYGAQPNKDKLNGDEPQFIKDYFDYYKTPRGYHDRSINSNGAWATTSAISLINSPILSHLKDISPTPTLLIAGENAHSRYMSEDIYAMANQPKELLIIPGASHVDLYDRLDVIPFEKTASFFKAKLK